MSNEASERAHQNLVFIANTEYKLEVDEKETYPKLMGAIGKKFFSFQCYTNKKPKSNCKKCYGRGFLIRTGVRPLPCACLKMKGTNNG